MAEPEHTWKVFNFTLRDVFALGAMVSLLFKNGPSITIGEEAYKVANNMLAERKKKDGQAGSTKTHKD